MLPKAKLAERMERRRAFCQREMTDRILAIFHVPLGQVDHLRYIPDMQKMFEVNIRNLELSSQVDDDHIPVAETHYGMGIFGGMFGGEVILDPENATSWSHSPLKDWRQLEELTFDKENYWVRQVRETARYFAHRAQGRFGVGVVETVDALNLLVALRGTTQSYLDLYEYPKEVRRVMEFGVQFSIQLLEMQLAETGPFMEGWCDMSSWFPDRTIWLSVDAFNYCSPQVYVELGRPYMQQLIDHFGYGWQHLHSPGIPLLPEIVKLKNLVGIQIGDDLKYPRPFEMMEQMREVTKDIPLQISCYREEFMEGLERGTLRGGVEYHVSGVPTVEEANRLAQRAREYRHRGRNG